MNGNGYQEILNQHVILELMANFPFQERGVFRVQERGVFRVQERGVFRRLWWAQDGAPLHPSTDSC